MMTRSYVDVLIPLPLESAIFTYMVEDERDWQQDELVGKLVLVPFGRGRTLTGLVVGLRGSSAPSAEIRYKRVLQILPYPPIAPAVLRTWTWAGEYYMCSPGDILRAAVPAAFRPDGQQKYSFVDPDDFEEDELALFAERHPTFTIKQLRTDFPRQYLSLLVQWIESDKVYLDDEVEVKKRPGIRKGWSVSLPFLKNEDEQVRVREQLVRSKAALKAIDALVDMYEQHPHEVGLRLQSEPMTLAQWSEELGVGTSVITKLRTVGVIIPIEVEDSRWSQLEPSQDLPPLPLHLETPPLPFGGKPILVSYAPGSSPKERIPFAHIHRLLSEGKQVLLLCPSVSFLELISPILREVFGSFVRPYHTSVEAGRRRHIWLEALRGDAGVYVGMRGTVWLPLSRLGGVVVVDEEDRGYRQYEPAPRFTASHVAMMLAHFSSVPVVLTSASPSVETMLRTIEGRYALASSTPKPSSIQYQSVSLSAAFEKNKVQGRLLSFELFEAIQDTLTEQGIALLFYQRKGFAKQLSCAHCSHSPECPRCHTTYRYYQESGRLVCPVCGYHEVQPSHCPSCGVGQLQWVGTGVERLAVAVRRLFPGVDVLMDTDDGVSRMRTGIVLSTSYDAPYEWLPKVSMIGVVQLELLTSVPDFRANERTYQMLTKCYTSAPLLKKMVVQYLSETKPNALEAFEQQQYKVMMDHELEERHLISFPPFARQIDIIIQSSSQSSAYRFADHLTQVLRNAMKSTTVMGPTPLPPHKKETDIGYRLTLLIPLNQKIAEVRQWLKQKTDHLMSQYRGPQLFLYFDVDPL